MIRTIPALLVAALLAAPAAAAERRFTVTGFDRVQVEGPYQVRLATGRNGSATAIGSPVALDGVDIKVQARTLRIRPKRGAWGGYPGEEAGPVRIEVGTAALKGAVLNGSGSLVIDKLQGMRVDLSLAGSGSLGVDAVKADILQVASLGSGTLKLGGQVKTFRAAVQGTGSLDAAGLTAEDAALTLGTSGDTSLAVRRAVTVASSGAGATRISGSPACTVRRSGAGAVRCGSDQGQR